MTGPTGPGESRRPDDAAQLSEILAELQATAAQLGTQLGDLGRASADVAAGAAAQQAEALPSVRRILELAPPELRARLATAATSGLSATRDLADWLLTQVAPQAATPEPEELPIDRPSSTRAPKVTGRATPTIPGVTNTTWILTASVDNHRATEGLGFSVIGIKEAHRKRAMEIEVGDVLVYYLTKVMSFAGAVRVSGDVYEAREKIWPGQPGKPDIYPWRLATEPIFALPQEQWIPAATLRTDLEHVQKWPAKNWTLAFQGQLRPVSEHDSLLLLDRLSAAAALTA